ncbi:OmpA family protein [Aquimarina pacifica]|uniref:OmpA family protein n=1 Tax=Aquimarina pacifica TaxID=1296415 RepID=UPI00046EC6EF|nr:OmpA family protein [Aquimarina pacifica]
MIKTKIFIVFAITLLISQFAFAQKKSRADRFFEKGDYINAVVQYEQELNQEGYSKHILENISTSYYNTFQFRKAYKYLKRLTSGKFYERDKEYDNSYNFMAAQVLSALGEYDKSVIYLAKYKKGNGLDFNKQDAVGVIENFRLKENDYRVEHTLFNSDASEFGAVKIDSTVYFVTDKYPHGVLNKNYKWTHRPFLDIYKVVVDKNNKPISELETFSNAINSKLHEGNFCFSADGNTIYLSKSNSEKKKNRFDSINNNPIHIYKASKVDGEWGAPEKLPFNNINYSTEHPSLSADGTKLYFSSNMPGGYGGFDIYVADVNEDGTYGAPKNLGSKINTENREQFPFISEKGHLFFSSNGHLGLGMMDIFVSELKEGKLSDPINLGVPINSSYDDFSLVYHNEKDGFFASNRKDKSDDIYFFSQIGEIFPKEYRARFEVKDYATESYIPNSDAVLFNNDNEIVYESQLDSIASFDLKVFPGRYNFKASAEGYRTRTKPLLVNENEEEVYVVYLEKKKVDDRIAVTNNKSADSTKITTINTSTKKEEVSKTKLRELLLADKDGPPVIEKNGKLYFDMPPIYFDYNKWNIRSDSKKVLDKLATKLERYNTVYLKISSHTDSRGTDTYNQVLSSKRAESTRNYLALVGYVNARRMKFEGYGESQPIIDCGNKVCTEEEHQTNRRSEFEIIKF